VARKIEVEIVADALGYQRGLRQASAETEGFGSKLGGVAKTGMLAFAGGVAVAAGVLGESVKAAMGAQASQAALDQALRTTHQSVSGMTPALEEAAAASRKMGFTDEDAEKALTRLELATGNTKKAVADLSVAQDIARVKHLDLVTASGTLAQAMTGSQRAAKQLGIIVQPVTKNVDELKDSHVKMTAAAERAALAHAKLLDKMATGQAVIDATRDKVRGQAQAFSETAAGAMAQFHAQLENLEVTLGTALLPALTRVTQALADGINWLQQSKGAHDAVAAAGRGLAVVFHLIGDAIDWVKGHWAEISADATKAMDTVKAVVSGGVTVALALWHTFGATLVSYLQGAVRNITEILTGAFNVVEGLFRLVGDVIHGRWAKVWLDVQQIVKGAWQIIEGVFREALNTVTTIATLIGTGIVKVITAAMSGLAHQMGRLVNAGVEAVRNLIGAAGSAAKALGMAVVDGIVNFVEKLPGKVTQAIGAAISGIAGLAGDAFSEAEKVGEAIGGGVAQGIKNMAGSVASAAASLIPGATLAMQLAGKIHSPSQVTRDEVGVPMAQGVIEGFILGSADLPSKMKQTLRNAIEAARTAISSARGSFGNAWQQFTNDALAAFDAATNRMMAKLEAQRGQLTASEKKLARPPGIPR
jgi:hypothetical protein